MDRLSTSQRGRVISSVLVTSAVRATGAGWRSSTAMTVMDPSPVTKPSVPVVGVLRVCEVHTLFLPDDIAWDCMPSHAFPDQIVPRDTATWTVLHTSVARWPFVYLLTDYLPPDAAPQGSPDLAWEFAGSYPRPHDGTPVTVWRVTVRRS